MAFLASPLSSGQVTFFVAFAWSVFAWLYAEYLHYNKSRAPRHEHDEGPQDQESAKLLPITAESGQSGKAAGGQGSSSSGDASISIHGASGMLGSMVNCGMVSCLLLKRQALLANRETLRTVVEFGCLMLWYFLSDRTSLLPTGEKSYSRDVFLFIFVALTCAAVGSSLRTFKFPLLLNRPQTEEWKGWMQVLFLLYHYFEAKEVYNAIRIFIAGYVWMTGFGNFSYYYKTGDFCIGRFAQMFWRLNFLVFFACVVLQNSYMLYYICPMHTIFTVFVYLALAIAPQVNKSNGWLLFKIAMCFVFIFVTWDIKSVFYAIWRPFLWLVGYVDPRKPAEEQDPLHEWYFRSSLDRYIWIYGMLCALMHPMASAILSYIDELPTLKRISVRSAILTACGAAGYVYYSTVYTLPKVQYNAVHPYTSWIPITLWIIVRNMTPSLRIYHLRLYGWLGCITLETYISQFHIWMKTGLPDGQPKSLLVLIPGYPLLNFALVSGLYVLASHRLFEVTNALKNALVPHSNDALLGRNILLMLGAGGALWGVVAALHQAV
ncbi:hypothetical protein Agub_g7569 [Astrephomene gubernaculifera]|uniref:Cas1p 10 TM acyl transferase domain-containing protein n=1 Tax=Astrephomene gubernaculifera TaxID=47775 RepID=A0AAD3HLT4_9CHLO|nr:hypothetical protein Agub_g7569 [Astrephomene gubernaculifera]